MPRARFSGVVTSAMTAWAVLMVAPATRLGSGVPELSAARASSCVNWPVSGSTAPSVAAR